MAARIRCFTTGWLLLLAAADCSCDDRDYRVHLVFPDQASLAATAQVHIWAIKIQNGSCDELLSHGIASSSSAVLSEAMVTLPLGDSPMLEDIPLERVRFFAEGSPLRTGLVLRGCSELEVQHGVDGTVTIQLDWRCPVVADGGVGCADGGGLDGNRIDGGNPDRVGLDRVGTDQSRLDGRRDDGSSDRSAPDAPINDAWQTETFHGDLARPDTHRDSGAGDRVIRDLARADLYVPRDAGWDRAPIDGCPEAAWQVSTMTPAAVDWFGMAGITSDDQIHLVYTAAGVSESLMHDWGSRDTSWHSEAADDTTFGQRSSALAIDARDVLHVAYIDVADSHSVLHYASGTAGDWSIQQVPGTWTGGADVAIAVDLMGRPHIAYDDGTSGNKPGYVHFDGIGWNVRPVNEAQGFCGLRIAVDDQYRPHLAYCNWDDVLRHAVLDNEVWVKTAVAQERPSQWGWFSLAIDCDQHPHVAFTRDDNDSLWHAVDLGVGWQTELLFGAPYQGSVAALLIDPANRPHIGHFDTVTGEVKHTFWTGAQWCTQHVTQATGQSGPFSLLLQGTDLYIVFYNHVTGQVTIASTR